MARVTKISAGHQDSKNRKNKNKLLKNMKNPNKTKKRVDIGNSPSQSTKIMRLFLDFGLSKCTLQRQWGVLPICRATFWN
jgi:hypothetical protein